MGNPLLRRLLFSLALAGSSAASAAACSWDVDYLDSTEAGESTDGASPDVDATTNAEGSTDGAGPDGSARSDADGGSVYGADGGNLIQNPSCENGTVDWTTLAGTPIESSTAFFRTGEQHSCRSYDRVNVRTAGQLSSYDGPLQDISAAVVPGHQYTGSAWVLWAPPPSDAGVNADGEAGADEGGTSYPAQSAYITLKQTCGTSSTFIQLASGMNLPEEQWTQVSSNQGMLMVPTGCPSYALQLYIEGPDVGLDLYTADVSLIFYK